MCWKCVEGCWKRFENMQRDKKGGKETTWERDKKLKILTASLIKWTTVLGVMGNPNRNSNSNEETEKELENVWKYTFIERFEKKSIIQKVFASRYAIRLHNEATEEWDNCAMKALKNEKVGKRGNDWSNPNTIKHNLNWEWNTHWKRGGNAIVVEKTIQTKKNESVERD